MMLWYLKWYGFGRFEFRLGEEGFHELLDDLNIFHPIHQHTIRLVALNPLHDGLDASGQNTRFIPTATFEEL